MEGTFITCAVTGAGDGPQKNPHVPVTPEQIANAAIEAAKAGAAIAHIHVRNPETGAGSRDVDLYRQVVEHIRSSGTDIIINLTAGMGGDLVIGRENPLATQAGTDLVSQMERLAHVELLRPEICTLDCGSYNVGRGNLVYISTTDQIVTGARRIRELGVKPELEVFDFGHLAYVIDLISENEFDPPVLVQLCLGIRGAVPATPAILQLMQTMLPSENVIWSSFGVGRSQFPIAAQAVLLGGNVRVGLEDNLYLRKGILATNGHLVEHAVKTIELLGGKVLSPGQTRLKLGLKERA